ncbi:hypothetical protein ELI24_08380 [Rhizobium ruizarguesonis]|uniref:hypothetical protein n=1 Tax=Rhizobium ruizarguesonis TaxID=2081791 RepID=UPI001031EDE1|nr:hypothetical protein [Rhizobium ruizarguesonis]TAV98404.1 hypothetical protein ELI24_08380 [Rhizobium ruizarguesonis]
MFRSLVLLRDDLTHLDTGSLYLDKDTDKVRYDHYGITRHEQALSYLDIFGWLNGMMENVNLFLGKIFKHLNETLRDEPIFQMCGMVDGRALHRWVSPVGDLTFNSGRCGAWVWFEKPENPSCPFKDTCGAYLDKAPPQGWETDSGDAAG